MAPLRPNEEWARVAIEAATGVPVTQHDDGSEPAMHDLEIHFPGAPAAVEVTGAVDERAAELWNVANRSGRWIAPDLVGGWFVYVDPYGWRPRDARLHRDLPAFLRDLEELGVTEYPAATVRAARLDSIPSANCGFRSELQARGGARRADVLFARACLPLRVLESSLPRSTAFRTGGRRAAEEW
jgi:hypothetical protein